MLSALFDFSGVFAYEMSVKLSSIWTASRWNLRQRASTRKHTRRV